MANQQLKAKLVTCSVPTKNSAAARTFYDTLFGGHDFARSLYHDKVEAYYRPIDEDGLTLSIAERRDDREPITCFFAVDNLDEMIRQLAAAGGKVVVNPTPLPASGSPQELRAAKEVQASNSLGRFATMFDPDGNYLGLIELDNAMQSHFHARPEERKLSKEQVDKLEHWKQHGGAS
jgi:predicted enzyme related to lactoylglutathione lyase